MVKLSTFDEQDFAALNATEIRAKVQINETVKLINDQSSLAAKITNESGDLNLKFELELVKMEQIPAKNGFFSNSPAYSVSYFRLSPTGIENFKKIQAQVIKKHNTGFEFSVGTSFDRSNTTENEEIYLSIGIKFDDSSDYITIIDDWELEFES